MPSEAMLTPPAETSEIQASVKTNLSPRSILTDESRKSSLGADEHKVRKKVSSSLDEGHNEGKHKTMHTGWSKAFGRLSGRTSSSLTKGEQDVSDEFAEPGDNDFSDPSLFVDNNVAAALAKRAANANGMLTSGTYTKEERDRCLKILGFYEEQEQRGEDSEAVNLHPSMGQASEQSWNKLPMLNETLLLKHELFTADTTSEMVQRQHMELIRILPNIFFWEQSQNIAASDALVKSGSDTSELEEKCGECFGGVRARAQRFLKNVTVGLFYLCLTVYALLGPDIVKYIGIRDLLETFSVVNLIVFILFFIELIALLAAHQRYYFTMAFIFDVVCLISMVDDTWIYQQLSQDGIVQGESGRVSRLARSTRVARLFRVLKIARVARLVPHLMAFFRRQDMKLGEMLFTRRLWRIFSFLDVDADGLVSPFDLKVTYLLVMLECPLVVKGHFLEVAKADCATVQSKLEPLKGRQEDDVVNWHTFREVIMSTRMGRSLIQRHVQELASDEGIWTLTRKLSDSTAIKVCAGIIVLLASLAFLEFELEDTTIVQGLAQLYTVAKFQTANQTDVHIREQVGLYRDNHGAASLNRSVVYLHLNGRTYVDGGEDCAGADCVVSMSDAIDRIESIVKSSTATYESLLEACWPQESSGCHKGSSAIVLMALSTEQRAEALSHLLLMTCIICLFVLFVSVINRKITTFARTILQPLRWLVDDMMACTSPEMLQIFKDLPGEGVLEKVDHKVEELTQLESAFESLQLAIRSWSMYVPPCVVQRLFAAGVEATVGMTKVPVTILFCDISGFEDTCKGLDPKETIEILARVLSDVAEVIQMHNGTLLEFIGDEVVAVFNTPNKLARHSLAGAMACRDIHRVLDIKNVRERYVSQAGKDIEIRCRCGVHTAYVLAGNIGSQKRIKYGLLGDGINLAARLKGLNSRYHTRTLTTDELVKTGSMLKRFRFAFRPVDVVAVKGKEAPTTVYELMTTPEHPCKETDQMMKACEIHTEAFKNYQAREFAVAKEQFREAALVLDRVSEGGRRDVASRLLRSRCQGFIDDPPPPEWDGVDRLAKKSFEEELQAMTWMSSRGDECIADEEETPPQGEGSAQTYPSVPCSETQAI